MPDERQQPADPGSGVESTDGDPFTGQSEYLQIPSDSQIDILYRWPRIAIVTGAGSGLGRAFCLALANHGDQHVILADRDDAAAQETLALMQKCARHYAGEVVCFDVTDRAAWQQLVDRVEAMHASGDYLGFPLLINNAGICAASETLDSSPDQWRRIMEVNFFGVLNGCQAFGPHMVREAFDTQKKLAEKGFQVEPLGGAIINVASLAGMIATPSMGAYAASKSAVVALSESLYGELRPHGVKVTVVAPGFFRTNLLDRGEFCTTRHKAQAERLFKNARFIAEDVALAALAASSRGDLYCIMGRRARWLWRLKRLAPRLVAKLAAHEYHKTFGNDR